MGFAHYFKRELESHFVHIFSNASVPVSGSIKNMVHYWFFYGILTTVEIFFLKSSASDWNIKYYYIFAAIWTVRLNNLQT
jgi:very-long-chain enoyl-CoA reductase